MKVIGLNAAMSQIEYSVENLKLLAAIREAHLIGDFLSKDCPAARHIGNAVAEIMQKLPADYNSAEGRLILSQAITFLFRPVTTADTISFCETAPKSLDSASCPTEP